MTTNQMWATLWAQRFSCSSVYLAVCFFSPYFFSFQMRMLWVMATKSLIKVYYICGPHLLHTDCHTVVEGSPCWLFLITFLPSYPSHVCEWFSRRHVPWSFQESKWSWLAFTQWSSQGCPFFTSWGLTACVFPVVIQQSQPPRFVRENRQHTMKSHKLILSALLGKPHPAPYIWIHPGSPSSTYCVVPPLFPVLPVSKLCWHTQWSGSKLCLWKPK